MPGEDRATGPDDGDQVEGGLGEGDTDRGEAPAEGDDRSTLASFAFFLGLIAIVGSVLAFAVALVTGGDVALPIAGNVVGAVVVVAWTAVDTYTDPESGVTSLPGALGTALLLLGAYALVASAVVALTSPWHARFDLALGLAVAAAVVGVLGFFTFPAEVVVPGDGDGSDDGSATTGDPTDGE